MTLDQLRVFVEVAERQHMTKAARALNMTQSAASYAIAALEARHGTRLFDRIGRRIELSEAGTVLLGEARKVLAQVDAVDLALSDFSELRRGTLAVQASQTIASYWLPGRLVSFHRSNPEIKLSLKIGNTMQVASAVREGIAELGFVEGEALADQLVCTPVARDKLVIVVAPDHPWAKPDRLTPDDLLQMQWVLREPGSGTRSAFEEGLARFAIRPGSLNVVMELPSNESVRSAVESGLGATALSVSVAAPAIEAGLLRLANFPLPERSFYLVRHPGRYRTQAANALAALVLPPSATRNAPRAPSNQASATGGTLTPAEWSGRRPMKATPA